MKYFNNTISALFLLLLLFTACSSDPDAEPGGGDNNQQLPPWNKANTISVGFVGKLNGEPLTTETEIKAIGNYLQSKDNHIVIIDRCDVNSGTGSINPSVLIAATLKKVHTFARNQITGTAIEGSGVLIGHTVRKQEESKIMEDCFLKSVETRISKTQPVMFSTVCIQNNEQIPNAVNTLKIAAQKGNLIVGSIRKDLFTTLEEKLKKSDFAFRLEKAEETSKTDVYTVFVLSSHSWVLRNSTVEKAGTHQVFNLQIELL